MWKRKSSSLDELKARVLTGWWHFNKKSRAGPSKQSTSKTHGLVHERNLNQKASLKWSLKEESFPSFMRKLITSRNKSFTRVLNIHNSTSRTKKAFADRSIVLRTSMGSNLHSLEGNDILFSLYLVPFLWCAPNLLTPMIYLKLAQQFDV